ncbi:MAG: hypothetical protein V8T87_11240 [Victivallales bacterium]
MLEDTTNPREGNRNMLQHYTDERNIQIVISLLKAHGIKRVVASPGTTNLSFVASIQQDSFLRFILLLMNVLPPISPAEWRQNPEKQWFYPVREPQPAVIICRH